MIWEYLKQSEEGAFAWARP